MGAFNSAAETTISYECVAPELDYVSRFSMSGTIVTGDLNQDSPTSWISRQTISGTFTKRGTNQESEQLSFNLSGKATRVASASTLNPFINLKLKNKDQTQLIHLNLNYPTKLSSTVKTEEGYLYKSTCKITTIEKCAFGNDYFDALENPAIKNQDLGVVKKEMEAFGGIVPVQKTKVTLQDGRIFFFYYTFDDSIDGGNTYGQVEDSSGAVVTVIEDSSLYQCKIKVPAQL
jgi:hypothetical protein